MAGPGRIDVHHHMVPDFYRETLAGLGITVSAGVPLPSWSPAASLEVLDAHGIAAAILSLSFPGVYFGDPTAAKRLARECNEAGARIAADHPGRFGWFAVLPLPLTGAAVEEAIFALDTLHADGVVLLASNAGKFLGDPAFEELMAELDVRGTVAFVHPAIHPSSEGLGLDWPGFLVEFLFDTTRAVANLIFSGTLERHRRIRWILSHAGGTIPYIWWRLQAGSMVLPSAQENFPSGVVHYLQQLYYDTALSPSAAAIGGVLKLAGPSRVLFGSDFPFAPARAVAREVADLDGLDILDDETRRRIAHENAGALFPRFARGAC